VKHYRIVLHVPEAVGGAFKQFLHSSLSITVYCTDAELILTVIITLQFVTASLQ